MPRGYAPGSISAGFQGTHGPRRAWNTPPGLVDGARGAWAGPAVRASTEAAADVAGGSSTVASISQA